LLLFCHICITLSYIIAVLFKSRKLIIAELSKKFCVKQLNIQSSGCLTDIINLVFGKRLCKNLIRIKLSGNLSIMILL